MVKEIHSAAEIKKLNVASVKRVILKKGSATKPEVAELTGLSVVTCGHILNELTTSGTIVEESLRLSSGGRPAMSYRFSEKAGNTLCLYAYKEGDSSFIRHQILDLAGNIKDVGVCQKKTFNINALKKYIQEICKPEAFIKVIVIGIQGCINNGIVEFSDFTELSGVRITDEIQSATGIPTLVENDMNTIALGYSKSNPNSGANNIAILFFPRGQTPAGGFIVDGNILRGSSNLAGELSFFPFNLNKESQQSAFSNIKHAEPVINQLLIATTVFLDPSVIVITGGLSNSISEEKLLHILGKNLKRSQLPKIEIRPMVETEYFLGLHSIAVEFIINS